MVIQQREDIKQARKSYKAFVQEWVPQADRDFVYNLLVKAYLKGYYAALKNTRQEFSVEE